MHLADGKMMEEKPHSITVKVADKDYNFTATPDKEELIRAAAASLSKKYKAYAQKLPGKDAFDILAFAALNESLTGMTARKQYEAAKLESEKLCADIEDYLKEQ